MSKWPPLAVFLLAVIGVPSVGRAQSPDWSLRDYIETIWTHHNGLPLARAGDMLQTTDGYLWFTSQELLVRFDGVRFVTVPTPCDFVESLERGQNGSLWILCRGAQLRLFRRTANGAMTEVPLSENVSNRAGLFLDSQGRLWIHGRFLARVDADGTFREVAGDFDEGVTSIVEDAAGTLWLATPKKVVRMREDHPERLPYDTFLAGLAAAKSGGVFACGQPHEILYLDGSSAKLAAAAPSGVTFQTGGPCLDVDSAGRVWVGTRQHGIALIQDGRVETSPAHDGTATGVSDVFVDREDSVWVASSRGLHRFRRPHARLVSAHIAGMPANPTHLMLDSRGELWVDGEQLVRLNLATRTHVVFEGFPDTRALGEDETGRVWVATAGEIGRVEGRAFKPVRDVSGAPVRNVFGFTRDGNGHLWAVAEGRGIYQITPGPPRLVIDEPRADRDVLISSRDGIWVTLDGGGSKQYVPGREPMFHELGQGSFLRTVMTLAEEVGAIWAGNHNGLWRWRNGRWTNWTREHGLPGTGSVHEITGDGTGRLWLMTSGGILALSRAELDATPDGTPGQLRYTQIGALDRVLPHQGPPTSNPRIGLDRRGLLYFATIDSVAVVDPAAVTPSSLRPTITLESVVADNETVDPASTRRLTAPSRVQFQYTSLSLRSPENIRFRYRLEGYDTDWIEAGNVRHVTYGTLRPGPYRFRVIGSGSEGVWNDEGASYAFHIVPLFYNTWWFRSLIAAGVMATMLAAYRLRVRRLTQTMQLRFEERLAERTRIAQDLHDTLLQGTLAASMHVQLAEQALDDAPSSPVADDVRSPLRRAMQLLSQVADEGRATVSGLRMPPVAGGIVDLLQQAAGDQPNHDEIDFRVAVEGAVRPLKPNVIDEIGRIAREAVVNAYKHSHARVIEVELVYTASRFTCVVRDDGRGVQQPVIESGRDGHWGLTGMRERAERAGGELHIRSSATAGTEVELSLDGRLAYAEATDQARVRWWRR